MPVSRRQVATVFTEELRLVRFPLARAVGFLAGVCYRDMVGRCLDQSVRRVKT